MQLAQQIKLYRQKLKLSQDQLAEQIFVTRQTISNWENDKNYPDIHSIILLSQVFEVSIDTLIQGDLATMQKKILHEDQREMDRLGKQMLLLMLFLAITTAPLIHYLNWVGFGIFIVIGAITFRIAQKIEVIKKDYDAQTYREIVAFSNGEYLDTIQKEREKAIRPYQKPLIVLIFILFFVIICLGSMKLFGLF